MYCNVKMGKFVVGMEDKVLFVIYVIGIMRIFEDVNNLEIRGWRLIEM